MVSDQFFKTNQISLRESRNFFDFKNMDFSSFVENYSTYCDIFDNIEMLKENDEYSKIYNSSARISLLDPAVRKNIIASKNMVKNTIEKAKIEGVSIPTITTVLNPIIRKKAGEAMDGIKDGNIREVAKTAAELGVEIRKVLLDVLFQIDLKKMPISILYALIVVITSLSIIYFFTFLFGLMGITGLVGGFLALAIGSFLSAAFIIERARLFAIKKGFGNEFTMTFNILLLFSIFNSKGWYEKIVKILSIFSNIFVTAVDKYLLKSENETLAFWMSVILSVIFQILGNIRNIKGFGNSFAKHQTIEPEVLDMDEHLMSKNKMLALKSNTPKG